MQKQYTNADFVTIVVNKPRVVIAVVKAGVAHFAAIFHFQMQIFMVG